MTGEVSPVAVVELPSAAYSIDVVKRASYALMHRITVSFYLIGDHIICRLAPAGAETDLALLERDFRREVLDQDLRVSIEARTEPIRSVVLYVGLRPLHRSGFMCWLFQFRQAAI